jgi:ATP-binding cassette subfamily B protein
MFDRQAQLLGTETRKARSVSKTLGRLLRYFKQYILVLVLVAVFVIVGTYFQVLVPDLTGQAVDCYLGPFAAQLAAGDAARDSGLAPGDFAAQAQDGEEGAFGNCWYTTPDENATAEATLAGFGGLILLIVGLYLGTSALTGIQFYLMSWGGFQVLRDLQRDIFYHIHRLTLGFFSKQEAGDVMSRVTNDIDTLQQVIGFGLVNVIQGILLIAWIVFEMVRKNAPLSAVTLITLPLMIVATRWFSDQARKAFRRARQEIGSVNADLQENISAVREVQAFSREAENIEQFQTRNAANRDANIQAQAYTSALAPTLEALSYVSMAIVAAVGGIVILNGQGLMGTTVSVGLIVTFIAYTQQFNRPVQQIALLWTNIQSAVAGAERIFDLMDEEPELSDKPDAVLMPVIEGKVALENVWAEYNPGEPVLKGIDISAEKGQTIAIVGPTGAGKTTIINLLPRFWDVTKGRVMIDGLDVRDVTRASLRSQMGIVLQDTFLFSDTVMNNIRYGRQNSTDEEVIAAAKLARAHEFIQKLENGYETVLGERGAGLSQGQRQLLAIARVALTNPRILILDEATSSVDTRTEREIQAALDTLLSGRTSFVIAHRLSTIRNAEQVLVLQDGRIIERGTHQSLLAAKGCYHEVYMSQFRRQVDEDVVETAEVDEFFVPGD